MFLDRALSVLGDSRRIQEGNKEVEGEKQSSNVCYQADCYGQERLSLWEAVETCCNVFYSTKGVMVFRHIHNFPVGRADTSG